MLSRGAIKNAAAGLAEALAKGAGGFAPLTSEALHEIPPAQRILALARYLAQWRNDPVRAARFAYSSDPLGDPVSIDQAQAKIMTAVAKYDRVIVRTARGIGKTTTAAFLTHWWLGTRRPAQVVTSAGSWAHLSGRLWPEIRTWSANWLLKDWFEFQEMGIYARASPHDATSHANPYNWRAVATSSDQMVNVEGFHSPHLLLIVDEAKGMGDDIFHALRGSLTSARGPGTQKIVALSTPPLADVGWFARASKSSDWHTVHVQAQESDRVSAEWIEEIARDHGIDSPFYQSHVLGEIPQHATAGLIHLAWLEAAQERAPRQDHRGSVITCDVAREGGDLTTVGCIAGGRWGLWRFADGKHGWFSGQATTETVGRCRQAVLETGARALVVDDTGVGGGVTDGLREKQRNGDFPKSCSIYGEKFGASARRKDRFHNRKSELWWIAREAVRDGSLALPSEAEVGSWHLPRGSDFREQIASAIYSEDSSSRVQVWDKNNGTEFTAALPNKSPDLAHALILGVDYWRRLSKDEAPPAPRTTEELFKKRVVDLVKESKKRWASRGEGSGGDGNPYFRE